MTTNRLGFGLGLLATFAASAGWAQPAGEPPACRSSAPRRRAGSTTSRRRPRSRTTCTGFGHGALDHAPGRAVRGRADRHRHHPLLEPQNPDPARWTHNTRIEIAWTLVPVVILIVIGSFSLPVLFKQLEVPPADLTIKATGNQWYWSYYYPANELTFDSVMLPREDLEAHGYPPEMYLLATDTAVVVPVGKVVHMQVTGADVIHCVDDPGVRREDRRGARAAQRDLVRGRGGGHLLRPVLRALRQEPQLHADHRQGGEPGGLRRLARLGDRRVRRHPARDAAAGAAAAAEPPAAEDPAAETPGSRGSGSRELRQPSPAAELRQPRSRPPRSRQQRRLPPASSLPPRTTRKPSSLTPRRPR